MSPEARPQRNEDDDRTYRLVRPVTPPPLPRRKPAPPHPLRHLLLGKLPLETETSLFLLVNLLDFFVTYWLLMARGGNMQFVESNPVARYFIESWGPVKGMLGFKLTVVTAVCIISQVIALKRLDLARKVLWIGILATGCVVIYSVLLYLRHA